MQVTTLVMQGTSEEAMVTRRHTLRRKSDKLPAMEEDESLSKFLQNPTFLRPEDIESPDIPSVEMPLVCGTGDQIPDADPGEIAIDVQSSLEDKDQPLKRRKTVHFG